MGPEQDPLVSESPREDARSTTEIKGDIRRTRDRLDDTLESLNERLSPRSIINDILSWFESQADQAPSGAANSFRRGFRGVIRQIKENPFPAVLIGTGIAYMILRGEDEDDSAPQDQAGYEAEDSAASSGASEVESAAYGKEEGSGLGSVIKEKAGQAQEAFSGAIGGAAEKMADVGSSVQARASSVRTEIGRGIHRSGRAGTQQLQKAYGYAGDRFQEAVEEYPLAVAVGFIGVGLLSGLLLPRTRQEDKLMGEKSDQLIEQAKETGKEALEKTKSVAQRVAQSALDEAQRQGLTPKAAEDKISEIAHRLGSVASQAKEEATRAVEEQRSQPSSGAEGPKQAAP